VGLSIVSIWLRSSAIGIGVFVSVILFGTWPAFAWGAVGERGFERVSPAVKGANVEIGGTARAASVGDVVAYTSFGALAPGTSRVFSNVLQGERTATGWTTVSMNPPFDPYPVPGIPEQFQAVSPDAKVGLAKSWGLVESGVPQTFNLWRFDAVDGKSSLVSAPLGVEVSPETPLAGIVSAGSNFAGGSEDFSHIVFHSSRQLIQEAPEQFDRGSGAYLYEWVDGQLRLVSMFPEAVGGGFAAGAVLGYGHAYSLEPLYSGQYAVAADGGRVFFSTPRGTDAPEREVFVRQETASGPVSGWVSESERTDCAGDPMCGGDNHPDPLPDVDAPKAALFQLASGSAGGPAFFASPQKLTDQATASNDGGLGASVGGDRCAFSRCSLYRWNPAATPGERLTDLTAGAATGGGVLAVIGGSDDASQVYFVATGVLAVGGINDQPNLYLWQQGQGIRHVATLDSSIDPSTFMTDEGVWSRSVLNSDQAGNHRFGGSVRVSRDGRFMVFRSRMQLTSYDNGGYYQVYRFDAVTGSLVCVSCTSREGRSSGDAFLKRERIAVSRPPWVSRNLSTDGSVVFETAEALVPADTNGMIDVYEWSNGQVRLISSGQDADDSAFLDASESGADVFFTTGAQLVRSDEDSLVDLYDARIGGGRPEPEVKPDCQDDNCQGTPSPSPTFAAPVTSTGSGGDDVKAVKTTRKERCRKGLAKKRVRGRTRCVKKKAKKAPRRAGHGVGKQGR
jgi:hypothetical protein